MITITNVNKDHWDDEEEFGGRCDVDNNDEQKENTDYYRDEDEQHEYICEHQLGQ